MNDNLAIVGDLDAVGLDAGRAHGLEGPSDLTLAELGCRSARHDPSCSLSFAPPGGARFFSSQHHGSDGAHLVDGALLGAALYGEHRIDSIQQFLREIVPRDARAVP